jgi:predicted dehydrogenase
MTIDRRQFIQTAAGAVAAATLARRGVAATDTKDIRVAQIGFRSRGQEHIDIIRKNVVALCDVDEKILSAQVADFKDKHHQTVDGYTDYRKLLERKDIDAVSIATPNHTHSLIAIAAVQAGKDVYVEKPVSHNIWEGRQLVAAARRYNRIVQAGTQSRTSKAMQDAVAFVRGGALGEIRLVTGTCFKPRKGIGKLDKPLAIPGTIDYDLWCGPAKQEDLYRPQLHYDWHWDFNTGNGDLGNQGIHQMDIARWMLGESTLAPRVFSVGGRVGYEDAGNTPNTQIIYHAYAKAPLLFEVRGMPRARQYQKDSWGSNMDTYRGSRVGVVVQCERGYVVAYSYYHAKAFDNEGKVVKEWKVSDSLHHDNWLQAIAAREPKLLNGEIYEGHVSSALCHVGNVAYRVGSPAKAGQIAEQVAGIEPLANAVDRMFGHLRANGVDIDSEKMLTAGEWLDIDPAAETFVANDAATALRSREYRKPFAVPDIEHDTKPSAIAPV